MRAVVRDVHHHVADPDDGHAAAHGIGLLAEWRQAIVVVDEVFGVVHAGQPLTLDAEVLRSLRPDGEDQGVEADRGQVGHRQVPGLRDRDVAQVGHAGIGEDLLELPAKPALHLVFVEEDAVLGEPARLDVPVQQHHAAAGRGEGTGGEETSGAGADHRDGMERLVGHERT